jgi:hypothetical protein
MNIFTKAQKISGFLKVVQIEASRAVVRGPAENGGFLSREVFGPEF